MLALGVLATLTANAYSGSARGIAGMALASWPGLAFLLSSETALGMVRRSAKLSASTPDTEAVSDNFRTPARPALSVACSPPDVTATVAAVEPAKARPAKLRAEIAKLTAKPDNWRGLAWKGSGELQRRPLGQSPGVPGRRRPLGRTTRSGTWFRTLRKVVRPVIRVSLVLELLSESGHFRGQPASLLELSFADPD
jgi:hypothetical protein